MTRKIATEDVLIDRFWSRVNCGASDECWIWTGATNGRGYGHLKVGGRSGRWVSSHRFAWECTLGPIKGNLWVLHRCDNRRCCNPGHLFLGTVKDNTQDMLAKGREARALRVGGAKLSPQDVLAIRLACVAGEKQEAVARRYGVTQPHVSNLVNHKRYLDISKASA